MIALELNCPRQYRATILILRPQRWADGRLEHDGTASEPSGRRLARWCLFSIANSPDRLRARRFTYLEVHSDPTVVENRGASWRVEEVMARRGVDVFRLPGRAVVQSLAADLSLRIKADTYRRKNRRRFAVNTTTPEPRLLTFSDILAAAVIGYMRRSRIPYSLLVPRGL